MGNPVRLSTGQPRDCRRQAAWKTGSRVKSRPNWKTAKETAAASAVQIHSSLQAGPSEHVGFEPRFSSFLLRLGFRLCCML